MAALECALSSALRWWALAARVQRARAKPPDDVTVAFDLASLGASGGMMIALRACIRHDDGMMTVSHAMVTARAATVACRYGRYAAVTCSRDDLESSIRRLSSVGIDSLFLSSQPVAV